MKLIFNIDYIKNNQLLFWIYVISIILIILVTCFFVKKEVKK